MGFKRITRKELETSLSPAFLGLPLKHIEEETFDFSEEESVKIRTASKIFIVGEEVLEYDYDKHGNLEHFVGNGIITIINNSKKDRIWDGILELLDTDNINLKDENYVKLGIFEPETNKKINYSILNPEDLPNPLKLSQNVELLSIDMENIGSQIKEKKISEIEETSLKKQELVEEKIRNKYNPKIEETNSKITESQNELSKIRKNIEEWNNKEAEMKEIVGNLENELEELIIEKSEYQNKKLSSISIDDTKITGETDLHSALEKIRNKVKNSEAEVPHIKEKYEKEKTNSKKHIDNKFDPKIEELKSKLDVLKKDLESAKEKNEIWSEKEKELKGLVKSLKKDHKSLVKDKSKALKKVEKESEQKNILKEYDPRINKVEAELEKEQKNYQNAVEKVEEWSDKVDEYEDLYKQNDKELEKLIKEKNSSLEDNLEDLEDKKDEELEEIQNFIDKKTKEIDKIQSVIKEFDPKIQEQRTKLESETRYLNEIRNNLDEMFYQAKNIEQRIEKLTKKLQTLQTTKKNTLENKLTKISEEKKIKKKRFLEKGKIDDYEGIQNHYPLVFNQKNSLKFTITLENTSDNPVRDIKLGKIFTEDFSNLKYEGASVRNVNVKKGNIVFTIPEIKPHKKTDLIIYADIYPREKKIIGTGRVHISYEMDDVLFSGNKLKSFSAYSHAMHAIKVKEKETEPNKWTCSLIFRNNSNLEMELNSIVVLDKDKTKKWLDLNFSEEDENRSILPGDKYISEEWEVSDNLEPKFFRKLEYSVNCEKEKLSRLRLNFDEDIFEIIDMAISKRFSELEIKSFEKSEMENILTLKNIGTFDIKSLITVENYPKDFIISLDSSDYKIRNSSGTDISDKMKVKIKPKNQDPSTPHTLEIELNLEELAQYNIVEVEDFIEIKYPIYAISPDYNKDYEFPLEITSYYPKEKGLADNYYKVRYKMGRDELPDLTIVHKRRDLTIGKEIFPGRNIDEFAISIIVTNNSNVEINDININDTISKAFELVSSNLNYEI
ncbi:MAG: hypothetical protein GF353_10595, partial [Candidatus Lokiarchaeota archaeon]|nr:hypothetical protein [Candidatus Lokiarchaeota archaeon]